MIREFSVEQVNPNDSSYEVISRYVDDLKEVGVGDLLFDVEGQKVSIEIRSEASGIFYSPHKVGSKIAATDVAYFIASDLESCLEVMKLSRESSYTDAGLMVSSSRFVGASFEPLVRLNDPTIRVVVLPGGKAFRQIQDAVQDNLFIKIVGYFDDAERVGGEYLGRIDQDQIVKMHSDLRFDRLFVACGDHRLRTDLLNALSSRGLRFINIIHPKAFVSNSAALGCNIYIGPFVQIASRAIIEDGVFISAGSNIEHHCHVAENCLLGPGVVLSGGVSVGRRTVLAAGVSVESNISIGEDVYVSPGKGISRNIKNSTRVID